MDQRKINIQGMSILKIHILHNLLLLFWIINDPYDQFKLLVLNLHKLIFTILYFLQICKRVESCFWIFLTHLIENDIDVEIGIWKCHNIWKTEARLMILWEIPCDCRLVSFYFISDSKKDFIGYRMSYFHLNKVLLLSNL